MKFDKSIEKFTIQIDKNIETYNKYELSHNDEAIVAYVMLRSMEVRERLINAYKDGAMKRWCLINCCCSEKRYKHKYFLNEWINVKRANSPEVINWENLHSSSTNRFFRILFTSLFSLVLIVGTFVLLLFAQKY